MNKEEIYNYLQEKKVPFQKTEHEAVYTMEELYEQNLPYPDQIAKNLFVRDDKKRNYYLITLKGDKKINLKDFRKKYNLRNLSFASKEDLKNLLDLDPGCVSPFGLLNNPDSSIHFFLDQDLENSTIGIHPNDNTATVWLNGKSLLEILKIINIDIKIVEI